VRSALAVPSFNKREGIGVLYLENRLMSAAFPAERVRPMQLLSTQAAIALDNAMLYDTLDRKVALRTEQLAEKNAILEEKNAEIVKAQTQLVQSEKMASLGQLVAGVAHEMNNPISFVHSGLPTLRRDIAKISAMLPAAPTDDKVVKLTTRIGRLLDAMDEGTRRVTEIISNLRTFSRLDEAEYKQADLHAALEATLVLLRNKMRDRIEVVREYGEIPPVECFISQLNQVFMNLLANAVQAIPGEGTITIRTARVDADHIQIAISDTGCGMSEDIKNKIFDPFFTTKDVGEGTGLGLSIAHGVIDKHRGRIEVQSAPGAGTTFRIVLPVRAPNERAQA
jgi:signal transduction histidine kinase